MFEYLNNRDDYLDYHRCEHAHIAEAGTMDSPNKSSNDGGGVGNDEPPFQLQTRHSTIYSANPGINVPGFGSPKGLGTPSL